MKVFGKSIKSAVAVSIAMAFMVGCTSQTAMTQSDADQYSAPGIQTSPTSLAAGDALGMGAFGGHHEALAKSNNPESIDSFDGIELVNTGGADFELTLDDTGFEKSN